MHVQGWMVGGPHQTRWHGLYHGLQEGGTNNPIDDSDDND